jgi:N-acetylmuramoyl-L-alanine amidase
VSLLDPPHHPHRHLTGAARPLRRGDTGPLVHALRDVLRRATNAEPCTADAGPEADHFDADLEQRVRAFQQDRGLLADGVVGRQTALVLDAARWRLGDRILLFTPGHPMRGDDVAALQERLVVLGVHAGPVDGVFGPVTEASLRELQRGLGLRPDGICGPATLHALGALSRSVGGGDPWALRTESDVAVAGKSLAGKVVVLDPSHGGDGMGVHGHGLVEADITYDVARRVEGRLGASGVTAVLTRGREAVPDLAARVALTETVRADLVLGFHCEAHENPEASGFATFYWGGRRVGQRSAVGHRLATLVQREVVARTDLLDCRTHPCSFDIVRMTKMPTVLVGLGYLSNAGDARRLGEPAFRDTLADAVVVAVQRLYLADDDARTGTLNLKDVLAHAGRQ